MAESPKQRRQRHVRRLRTFDQCLANKCSESGSRDRRADPGVRLVQFVVRVLAAPPDPRCGRQAPELPHQVVRDLEGGVRIGRINLSAGLVHPHDERGIALADLVGDNPGHQFGGAALTDDHQAASH